jgi:hypothetical protein
MTTQHTIRRMCFPLILAAGMILPFATQARAMSLTDSQKMQVLAEAQNAYQTAVRLESTQPAAAREAYEQAAEKFQLLTQTADCDGELYRRLGDAQLRGGQIGKSIAGYRRAEQLLGPDPRITLGLAEARRLRDHSETAVLPATTFMEKLSLWNRSISLPWRFWVGLAMWVGLWAALGASIFIQPRAFRVSAGVCGLVFVLLAASLIWDLLPGWDRTRGVVTAPTAVLREGNGRGFAPCTAPLKDGAEFTVIERRGRWLRVKLPDGNTGWLDDSQAEVLPPRHTLWG